MAAEAKRLVFDPELPFSLTVTKVRVWEKRRHGIATDN
jgi:hypothetical protein